MRPNILVEVSSGYGRLHFRLNLMLNLLDLMDLVTLMDLTTLLSLFSSNSCFAHLRTIPSMPHFKYFAFKVYLRDTE